MKTVSKIVVGAVAGIGLAVAMVAYAQSQGFAHGQGGFGSGMKQEMGPGMGQPMMNGMQHAMGGRFGGPMVMGMTQGGQHDKAFAADMSLVHEMIGNHNLITRKVTNLANGINTITESNDPQTAQAIKAHVASMTQRLKDGREFNLFSPTIPVLFANRDKIKTKVYTTAKGVIVTQTSDDPTVVAALQTHASEVSELARDGMVAMMRSARARMGMMGRGTGAAHPLAMTTR